VDAELSAEEELKLLAEKFLPGIKCGYFCSDFGLNRKWYFGENAVRYWSYFTLEIDREKPQHIATDENGRRIRNKVTLEQAMRESVEAFKRDHFIFSALKNEPA
jgi:hypothetical protein